MARARITFDVTDPDAPVFVISVAAELTGMHPQTLRAYDRIGLVTPGRTVGGGRRYSLADLERLRTISELTSAGTGIEGVRRILELEAHVAALQLRVAELEAELSAALASAEVAISAALPHLPALRGPTSMIRYHPG